MSPDTTPVSRAIMALDLLIERGGGQVSVDDVARHLGVSDRAARRTIAALREAGIDVEATRGPGGGYRLARGVRLPVMFSAAEALALVMAVLDGHHAAAEPDTPVGAALGKVIRALPDAVGREARSVRALAVAASDPEAARPDPTVTSQVVSATASRRRIAIDYRSESGVAWREQVDPWAVVVRHGRWYLLCRSHRADAVRTYRLDRMSMVEQLDATAERPDDLDPVAELERNLGVGWEFSTHVTIDAPSSRVRAWGVGSWGELADADGRTIVRGTTSNPAMYAEWLAALPVGFTVHGGPELVDAVRALGERLLGSVR